MQKHTIKEAKKRLNQSVIKAKKRALDNSHTPKGKLTHQQHVKNKEKLKKPIAKKAISVTSLSSKNSSRSTIQLLNSLKTNWKYHTSYSDSMMDPEHLTNSNSFTQVFTSKNTHLLTLSLNQIKRYSVRNIRQPEEVFNLPTNQVREIQIDQFDRIWLLEQDNLVCRYAYEIDKIAFTIPCPNAYPSNNRDGNNLLVTENAVFLYSMDNKMKMISLLTGNVLKNISNISLTEKTPMNSQQTVSSTSSGIYITKTLPLKRKILQCNSNGDVAVGTFNQDGLVLELFNNISADPTPPAPLSRKNSSSFTTSRNASGSLSNKSNHSASSNQPSNDAPDSHTICRILKTYKNPTITDFEFSKDFNFIFLVTENDLQAHCTKKFTLKANFKRLVGSKSNKKRNLENIPIGDSAPLLKFNRKIIVLSDQSILQYSQDHYQIFYFGKTLQGQKSGKKVQSSKPNREVYFKSLAKDTTLNQVSSINFDHFEHFEQAHQDHHRTGNLRSGPFRVKRKAVFVDQNNLLTFREFG